MALVNLFRRAAEILERDATALKDSHTVDGRWRIDCPADRQAKNDVTEAMEIARLLRRLDPTDPSYGAGR
jgi:hypothetical protein